MSRPTKTLLLGLVTAAAGLAQSLAVTNARLVDGRTGRLSRPLTILVEGERIRAVGAQVAIPKDARVLDASAFWVTPGFIETHTHASRPLSARVLSLGITTAHTMPALPSPLLAMEAPSWGPGPQPRLRVTSPLFCTGWPRNLWPHAYEYLTPATPAEAREQVRAQKAKGYAMVKLIQDDSAWMLGPERRTAVFSPEILGAWVDEAHRQGMRALVHAVDAGATRLALEAGCDVLMHGISVQRAEPGLFRLMKAKGTILVPALGILLGNLNPREHARRLLADRGWEDILPPGTLAGFRRQAADAVIPPPFQAAQAQADHYWDASLANLKAAHEAGVPIALGSDQPAGIHTLLEMELMGDAGLTPSQILVAATWNAARALGLEKDLGTVEKGKLADFVLLKADPTVDIRNARLVEAVVKGGQYYPVQDLRGAAKPPRQRS